MAYEELIVEELREQKKQLIFKLKRIQSYFESSHAHYCRGWECSNCYPQLMASEIEELIKPMED